MSVSLLYPLGLLALASALLPIVLHLARRSEHRVTDFAALRWLKGRARPRRSVRVVERGLLALRMSLVASLALMLAEPVWRAGDDGRGWSVVAPGVDLAKIPGRNSADAVDWRWLAPGFPALDSPMPRSPVPIASLLRELDARLPRTTRITAWVPAEMAGLDGASLQLGRTLAWRVAPGRAPFADVAESLPGAFAVRAGTDRSEALRYLRAAAHAWSSAATRAEPAGSPADATPSQRIVFDVADSTALPRAGLALVWLRAGDLPASVRAWLEDGGTLLVEPRTGLPDGKGSAAIVWRDEAGRALARAQRLGRGRLVRLEHPLSATALPVVREGSFARVLGELLYPQVPLADRALARDVAPQPDAPRHAMTTAAPTDGERIPWLAIVVAALFLLERFMATSTRRWRSA